MRNAIFHIKSYLRFLSRSVNEHGLHSPFLFDLATKCFYDKKQYPEYELIRKYRQRLLGSETTIEVSDFGAGSRVFRSNSRKVGQIARNAGISAKRSELLARLVRYFNSKSILELGTSVGLATVCLASGKNRHVISIEGCRETAKVAFENLQASGVDNVQIVVGEFGPVLSTLEENDKFDLIYFDGNHQKDATLTYFDLLLKTAHNDSVWIFDDIHWSEGMTEAWEQIKIHPKVTVTIDTYQWGLVFFRQEQVKEHFVVRT